MAIVLRFNVLVVRKSAVSTRYPGGLEQFRKDWASQFDEDDGLFGTSDMGDGCDEVAVRLRTKGLSAPEDFARGDQERGFTDSVLTWLAWGTWRGQLVCWEKGREPGQAVDLLPARELSGLVRLQEVETIAGQAAAGGAPAWPYLLSIGGAALGAIILGAFGLCYWRYRRTTG